MSELLLEIFSEEIPALMQKNAEETYLDIFTKIFEENEISAKFQIFVGPRRIAVHVTHLPKYVFAKEIEIKGPQINAPESAISGFCSSNNTDKIHLHTKLINNQLYYFFIKNTKDKDVKQVLPELLTKAINKYVWPKSMHWGDYDIKWIRPIRNILCIFDNEILPFKFGHLTANNITYGHRLTKNKQIVVNSFDDYKNKLQENYVILDRRERTEIIKSELLELANVNNLFLKEDDKLLEEVTGLVEFPLTLMGKIPKKFLKLPKEVLISSMKTHQKYFSSFDKAGNFAPYFLFVANGKFNESELIVQGNEKVLSARLSDALYFYEQDLSRLLESALEKLTKVTFHEKIGNLRQKVERIEKICHYLEPKNQSLTLAARLCKSDLLSEMVGEFPELQGIMGYYYALHEQLGEEVAVAIKDHYKPQGFSDNSPIGDAAVLALADKLDSVVGLMSAGEIPTGSGDPYGLRRQTLGIIRIILDNKLQINIQKLIIFSASLYQNFGEKNIKLVVSFFEERAKFYFKNHYNIARINAVLDLELEGDLVITKLKLDALQEFLSSTEGGKLLTVYKRVSSILGDKKIDGKVNEDYFSSKYEKALFNLVMELSSKTDNNILNKEFVQALTLLSSILDTIADFFDHVMVNDEDVKIANNRLLLLQTVCHIFHKIAKFDRL